MFLTKKNAVYFNKPKKVDPNKPNRILPGWQDEAEQKKDKYQYEQTQIQVPQAQINLLQGEDFSDLSAVSQPKKQTQNKFYFNWDELNDNTNIQCEKRLIEEIVQPGGIRIKPNDSMLNDFIKEIKGMEVHIIGSLLLSKIQVNYPFQTKAKALYTIEFLAKRNEVYLSFFKAHVQKLKEFPQPQDNVQNYKKILKSVLSIIGVPAQSSNTVAEEPKPKYVDPGYNDDPKYKMSNFIQENSPKQKKNQNKKVIIGPGQNKQKVVSEKAQQNNNAFLDLDLLGANSDKKIGDIERGRKDFSFEQMLGSINLNNNHPQNNMNSVNFLI